MHWLSVSGIGGEYELASCVFQLLRCVYYVTRGFCRKPDCSTWVPKSTPKRRPHRLASGYSHHSSHPRTGSQLRSARSRLQRWATSTRRSQTTKRLGSNRAAWLFQWTALRHLQPGWIPGTKVAMPIGIATPTILPISPSTTHHAPHTHVSQLGTVEREDGVVNNIVVPPAGGQPRDRVDMRSTFSFVLIDPSFPTSTHRPTLGIATRPALPGLTGGGEVSWC